MTKCAIGQYPDDLEMFDSHHPELDVSIMGEPEEELDCAMPEYLAKAIKNATTLENVDYNGSEVSSVTIVDPTTNRIKIVMEIMEREFLLDGKPFSWEKATAIFEGIADQENWIFRVDKILSFIVDGKEKWKKVPAGKGVNMAEIEKRWNERIVPNNWDLMGKAGAEAYLAKYGKGISDEKLRMFASYAGTACWQDRYKKEADRKKLFEFENAMLFSIVNPSSKFPKIKILTEEEADKQKGQWSGDEFDSCDDWRECGCDAHLVEAKKYPNVLVHGGLNFHTLEMSSVMMLIDSYAMGEEISELACEGDGSYRFDHGFETDKLYPAPEWAYFETE